MQSFDAFKYNDFSLEMVAVHFSELDDCLAFMLDGFSIIKKLLLNNIFMMKF